MDFTDNTGARLISNTATVYDVWQHTATTRPETMKSRLLILCLITLLSAAGPAQARTYLVELVVFARHAGFGAEHWRASPGGPRTSNAVTLGPVGNGRFAQLAGSRMEMNHIAATLGRKGYRVVKHIGWVQPGLSRSKAVPVRISGNGVNGIAKVSLGHYLHLNVDLLYRRGEGGTVVRLKQSRKMRSRDIHYLDGPVLGVIALITPAG
jgi:hypothetical protein